MFKKLLVSCAVATMMSASIQAADNPTMCPSDADTFAQNVANIGSNLYQIGENSACIIVRGGVQLSSGLAQGTKFMADHPVFGLACIVGAGYTWYRWHKTNTEYRRVHNRDMRLIDWWRTTTEHWGPRRA